MLSEIEVERAVVGSILAGSGHELIPELDSINFSVESFGVIWSAYQRLYRKGSPIDHLTVANELKSEGKLEQVGGPAFLMELDQSAIFGGNIGEHVRIVKDSYIRRQIVRRAQDMAIKASNPNLKAEEIALELSSYFGFLGATGTESVQTMEHAVANVLDKVEALRRGETVSLIPTGIDIWDKMLRGIQTKKLTMIGGYPGVAKSALKNTMIFNMAKAGVKVGVFELEDPPEAMASRAISGLSSVPLRRIVAEPLDNDQFGRVTVAADRLYESMASRIFIDSRRGLTPTQIASSMTQMVLKNGVQIFFIDHWGEVVFDYDSERPDLAIGRGVRLIRDVAIKHNLGLVGLAHFSRPQGAKDKDPRLIRPNLVMFKNAAVYEEASRIAVGIWRDESSPGGVMATVMKQNEGAQNFDFWMPLDKPSALIRSKGGRSSPTEHGFDGHGGNEPSDDPGF